MVKAVNKKEDTKEKRQPSAIFCPNCGVPRSTSMKLAGFLGKKKTLRFACPACNIRITMTAGWGKGGKDDDFGIDLSAKDIIQGAKTTKQILGALKGF